MLEVAEALAEVLDRVRPLAPSRRIALAGVLGRVLAADALRRRRFAAVREVAPRRLRGPRRCIFAGRTAGAAFEVVAEIAAGDVPTRPSGPASAPASSPVRRLPDGADAVVMQEDTQPLDGDRVRITDAG